MSTLAIIPARGGSKRIPRKNIRLFHGKPIISYVIDTALSSALFDRVMVSTDDEEIAKIAEQCNAEVPFLRSTKNSNDHATTSDVLLEVIERFAEQGEHFDYVCCLYPTAPLITQQALATAFSMLSDGDLDVVLPVVPFSNVIDRALNRGQDGKVFFKHQENTSLRTQDAEPAYHDAGQFYWLRTTGFLKNPQIWTDRTGSIVSSPLAVQDIDTEDDWKLAELKYTLLHEQD